METATIKSRPLHNLNCRRSPEYDSGYNSLRPERVGSRSTRIHRLSFCPPLIPIKLAHGEKEAKQKQRAEESLEPQKNKPDEEGEEVAVQRPWNLRPRKMVTVETSAAAATTVPPEKTTETAAPKSTRSRVLAENGGVVEKKEKRKFRIALSKDEIEEDIFALTGARPARRPKKRPKNIEKQLDNVFPGLWLVGLTPEAYRIVDAAPNKK
ncbi:hypothetical protein ES319_D12G241900v1 [Gossypium barbadense]|uniref:DUF1639 domain-containing protein n=1 Tax=Gossypium barbadense TaxID=3634 RepID=A0A5J5P315_GOSBA|nr:hypothetical protein ES319_D12G241900v1 [Gossypium barbadense]KAB2000578.1 hypothetical protein ES319_D12G241900v1 [Gossypium barbadense]